jgi:NADPH:quinone reductase-like Zn-dependent oxidoreductase
LNHHLVPFSLIQGQFPVTIPRKGVVPGSDGAGVVQAIGNAVTQFQPGDKVVMHLVADPEFSDEALPLTAQISTGLGQVADGTLTEMGVFAESALMPMPGNMTFEEAATMTCSGLTAWNALMGVKDRSVKKGDWVLVQGTGGVSVAALQVSIVLTGHVAWSVRALKLC